MQKSDLHRLIADFSRLYGADTPVIVGSQALHAVSDAIPEVARRSIECDFLYAPEKLVLREAIDREMGVFSDYRLKFGY